MRDLNRVLFTTVILSSMVFASGCEQKSAGPKTSSKALPNAMKPYLGGDSDSDGKPKSKIQREAWIMKYDDADGLNFDLKNQCAIDLCGPLFTSDAGPDDAAAKASKASVQSVYEKEYATLEPILKTVIRRDQQVLQTRVQRLDETKAQFNDLKLEGSYRAIVNFLWAVSYLRDIYGAWNGKQFDDDAVREALKSKLSEADIENVKTMATRFLTLPHFEYSVAIDSLGLDQFLEKLAKSNDPTAKKAAAKNWAGLLLKQAKKLKTDFPLLFPEPTDALEALAAGIDLKGPLVAKLSDEIGNAMLYPIIYESGETFAKREVDMSQLSATYFTKLRAKNVENMDAAVQQRRFEIARYTCGRSLYGFAALKAHEVAGLESAPKLIESARENVLEAIADFTKNTSVATAVQEKVKAVRFQLPDPTSIALTKFKTMISDKVKDADDEIAILKSGKIEDLAILLAQETYKAKSEEDELAMDCAKANPLEYNDNSKSGFGYIQISWRTILQPASGFGVIAHEFGHEVSAQLRASTDEAKSGLYASIVSCLVERKADPAHLTSEEDFADAFAERTLRRYNAKNPSQASGAQNFACSLMTRDTKRWGTETGLSLKNPDESRDSHSTAFYRALQYYIDAGGKLSDPCAQVVSQGKPTMANSCLK